jgi:hypothetical protein
MVEWCVSELCSDVWLARHRRVVVAQRFTKGMEVSQRPSRCPHPQRRNTTILRATQTLIESIFRQNYLPNPENQFFKKINFRF